MASKCSLGKESKHEVWSNSLWSMSRPASVSAGPWSVSAHGCALFTLVPATQSSKCEISVYLVHNYKIPINSARGVSQSHKVCPNRSRTERRQSGHIPQNPSTWRDKGPKLQSWLSAGLRGNKTGVHKSNSGLSSPSKHSEGMSKTERDWGRSVPLQEGWMLSSFKA